jgi:hypothetical protein
MYVCMHACIVKLYIRSLSLPPSLPKLKAQRTLEHKKAKVQICIMEKAIHGKVLVK